jgi:hypothetical protein
MLSLEQINENRVKAGLRPILKKISLKKSRRKKSRKRLVNGDVLPDGSVFVAKDTTPYLKENPRPRKGGKRLGGAKKRHRAVLLAYLSNADNPIITSRKDYLKILGLSVGSPGYINHIFPRDELSDIETEGLARRRRAYSPRLAMVDDGLLAKAAEGNAAEAKLVYQRFEGWSDKNQDDSNARPMVVIQIRNNEPKHITGEVIEQLEEARTA